MEKKPYEERTDLEKCQSQWTKLRGLHTREEWSAAVVRAATAAELAANYAIRAEFSSRSKLPEEFVNKMLRWANGLSGKLDRLLIPLTEGTALEEKIEKLAMLGRKINETRNDVVHRGEFRDKEEATKAIAQTKQFVEGLVRLYEPDFELRESITK